MKALQPQIRAETDELIDTFIEQGSGDLAQVAWRQPGIVFFKYVLGMPIDDVPLCIDLTDTALNGYAEEARMAAWGGLFAHLHDSVSARTTQPSRDDMIHVLLNAEIDGERDVVRFPLSRNTSRGTRSAHSRTRHSAQGH